MNGPNDQQLLHEYIECRSEGAFAELVRRYLDLVYSAAIRMVGDAHLAQDVSQAVFAVLARSAPQLRDHPVLCGWLHRTTRNLASKTVRSDVVRRAREQEAATMNELLSAEPDPLWEQVAPHLEAELQPFFTTPVDDALLGHWRVVPAEELYCVGQQGSKRLLTQQGPVDEEYDACFAVRADGDAQSTFKFQRTFRTLMPVFEAISRSGLSEKDIMTNGRPDFSALQSFAQTPEQKAALELFIQDLSPPL